jgi:Domain of unknown function (DUF5659)
MVTKKDFYFCYNKNLASYIHSNGIDSFTTALSPSTGKKFSMFLKSPQLQNLINSFNGS